MGCNGGKVGTTSATSQQCASASPGQETSNSRPPNERTTTSEIQKRTKLGNNVRHAEAKTTSEQRAVLVGKVRGDGPNQQIKEHGLYRGKGRDHKRYFSAMRFRKSWAANVQLQSAQTNEQQGARYEEGLARGNGTKQQFETHGLYEGKSREAEARHTFSALRFDQTWVVHLHNGLFRCMVKDELVDRNVVRNGLTTVCAL
jgi:hypothetical protein